MPVKVATARLPDPLPAGTLEATLRRNHPECRVAEAQFEKSGGENSEYLKYDYAIYWVRFDVAPQFDKDYNLEIVDGRYHVKLTRMAGGEWSAMFKTANWADIEKWAAAVVAENRRALAPKCINCHEPVDITDEYALALSDMPDRHNAWVCGNCIRYWDANDTAESAAAWADAGT